MHYYADEVVALDWLLWLSKEMLDEVVQQWALLAKRKAPVAWSKI